MLTFLKLWHFLVCIFCYKFINMVKINLVFTVKITVIKKDAAVFILSKIFVFPCLTPIRIRGILSSKLGGQSGVPFGEKFCTMIFISLMCFSLLSSVPDRKEKKLYENPDNLACDSKEYSSWKFKLVLCRVNGKEILVDPMYNSWSYDNGIKYN